MYHSDWFKLRYVLTRDYPGRLFDIGQILDAYEFEGRVTLDKDNSVCPNQFKDHFRLLKWYEHRTIEQLNSIGYAKVVEGSNYYVTGDIVHVIDWFYNNKTIINGEDMIMFNLKGHFFLASQVIPATKEECESFWENEKRKLK